MNNDFPNEQLDHLWLKRKYEINGIVCKNLFSYVIGNSGLVLVFLGFNIKTLDIRFPTAAFWGFVGGNLLLASIAHRFIHSEEQKGDKSGKIQYLVLMAWQNLFVIMVMLIFLAAAIAEWLGSGVIPLPISWLIALILLSILICIWWVPRKLLNQMNSYTVADSEKKLPSNTRYLWIIGLIILLSNILREMVTPDQKSLFLLIVSLSMGIWAISFVFYQFYRDYLLLKNGYLD